MAGVERMGQERVAFSVPPGGGGPDVAPLFVLAAGRTVSTMPELGADVDWTSPVPVEGWRLHVALTLCVLEGPDGGFLVGPLFPHDIDDRVEWANAFDRHRGAWVIRRPRHRARRTHHAGRRARRRAGRVRPSRVTSGSASPLG